MTSFVVETYVPSGGYERFEVDVAAIRGAAEALVATGARVHHLRSYFVPSDEMGFHVVQAYSLEDLTRLTSLAGVEVERIVEAIGVDADSGPEGRTDGAG